MWKSCKNFNREERRDDFTSELIFQGPIALWESFKENWKIFVDFLVCVVEEYEKKLEFRLKDTKSIWNIMLIYLHRVQLGPNVNFFSDSLFLFLFLFHSVSHRQQNTFFCISHFFLLLFTFFLHTQQKNFSLLLVFSSLFFVTLENFHEFLWSVRHHLHEHCTDDNESSMESDGNVISKFCTQEVKVEVKKWSSQ